MKTFQSYEQIERSKLLQWFRDNSITEYQLSQANFNAYDAKATINETDYIIEAKVVSYKTTDLSYCKNLLEVQKLQSLLQKAEELKAQVLYINFHPDKIHCYNLSKIDFSNLDYQYINCPNSTANYKKKVEKKCYLIPYKNTININDKNSADLPTNNSLF